MLFDRFPTNNAIYHDSLSLINLTENVSVVSLFRIQNNLTTFRQVTSSISEEKDIKQRLFHERNNLYE